MQKTCFLKTNARKRNKLVAIKKSAS